MMHAAAMGAASVMHAAAMPAASVAHAAAASSANLNKQAVVKLSCGGSRSDHFDGFRLRRGEADEGCDCDPSADRSQSSHGVPPLRGRAENRRLCGPYLPAERC
jgi:hypothetical protein